MAKPSESVYLEQWEVIPKDLFRYSATRDSTQVIPGPDADANQPIDVDLQDFESVHLAATGNCIVDAYVNLNVKSMGSKTHDSVEVMTLFIQYLHPVQLQQTESVNESQRHKR